LASVQIGEIELVSRRGPDVTRPISTVFKLEAWMGTRGRGVGKMGSD